ncbi:ATP-binding protein [Ruminococcus sp.]|jgi:predicted HTH transcriptional regulator|uniref:ATP-binding protein n=1 Tax=Ruminococcus sp. TaxID=41978 RepID=UPI0025E0825F|nr:ATP-binding protein [Ruminococcus sp.]
MNLIGETTEYDKKEKLEEKDPRSWIKSVSAFANGIGGMLIFGIEDKTDRIVGLSDAEGDAEKISRFLRERMDPIPSFTLKFEKIDDKVLIILRVEPGKETPYFYIGKNERTAYHRVGNDSQRCDGTKLKELVLRGSSRSFDSLPSGYDFEKMSFTKLISVYYQRAHKELLNTDYESFGIIDGNGELTNAGALLADNCPIYQSRLFCTRWNGLNKAAGLQDAIDDAEFTGSLVSLLQESEAFVKRNSHKGWFKAPDRRIELPDYPERSVTEGIVNALIHRNYLEVGSEVHIDMFDDRLEIYSPGGMYDGINVQDRDIMAIPSRRRNPIIADIFQRLVYMERRGSGFKKIIEDYHNQHNYTEEMEPIFKSEHDAFFLTLKNLNYTNKPARRGTLKSEEVVERAEMLLEYLREKPESTIKQLMNEFNLSEKKIKNALDYLKDNDRLYHDGPKRKGRWIINE